MADTYGSTPNRRGLRIGLIVAAVVIVGAILVFAFAGGGGGSGDGGGFYAVIALAADRVRALRSRSSR
jgi:hypothetical protein